jgi:hypothetical protein
MADMTTATITLRLDCWCGAVVERTMQPADARMVDVVNVAEWVIVPHTDHGPDDSPTFRA